MDYELVAVTGSIPKDSDLTLLTRGEMSQKSSVSQNTVHGLGGKETDICFGFLLQ